jgi:L-iditol 2-dehydrogenase
MKAAVIRKPGEIVVDEVPTPKPAEGEVLLKVGACAICGTDQRVLVGEKHVDVRIVGHEIAGRVAGVGPGVRGVREGERYAVQTVIGCGRCPMCEVHQENLCEAGFKAIGYQWDGGFAEYVVMPKVAVDQGCLVPIPAGMTDEVATLVEPLSCCINGMRPIPMETAKKVVIFGGGIIGVLNGLVARARGAREIAILDVSRERLDLHGKLGLPFDRWVDSSKTTPADFVKEWTGGRGADVVVVAASVTNLVPVGFGLLARAGHLSIFAGLPKSDPVRPIDLNVIHYREIHVHGANSSVRRDYDEAVGYLASGKIDGARLVTHRFSLDRFPEAVKTQQTPSSGALKVIIVP